MTQEKVICDKCNGKADLGKCVKETEVEFDVSVIYLECPSCGFKYLSYYADEKIKKLQQLQQKIKIKIKNKMETLRKIYGDDLNK